MNEESPRQVDVRIQGAVKRFGEVTALDRVSLDIAAGRFFFLLGPSGCGKTTLLRALAGLVDLDEGDISFGGRSVTKVPAHRRNTALVFQNYALWPHMSVFDNVAFGLVERKVPKGVRTGRVQDVLEMVRLAHLAARRPNELSGGQQQRVALARALVVQPDLVLLDEPLSNLDANLRRQMRYELKRIQEQTGITMIYVTHDQTEALSMAHRLAVMRDGRVMQVGSPEEVYRSPESVFVAGFVGRTNFVPGKVTELSDGFVQVDTELGPIWGRSALAGLAVGKSVVCSIRPEYLDWDAGPAKQDGPSGTLPPAARIRAEMEGRLFLGEVEERRYRAGGIELVARSAAPRSGAPSSTAHELVVQARDVVILPGDGSGSDPADEAGPKQPEDGDGGGHGA